MRSNLYTAVNFGAIWYCTTLQYLTSLFVIRLLGVFLNKNLCGICVSCCLYIVRCREIYQVPYIIWLRHTCPHSAARSIERADLWLGRPLRVLLQVLLTPTLVVSASRAYPPYMRSPWVEALSSIGVGFRQLFCCCCLLVVVAWKRALFQVLDHGDWPSFKKCIAAARDIHPTICCIWLCIVFVPFSWSGFFSS